MSLLLIANDAGDDMAITLNDEKEQISMNIQDQWSKANGEMLGVQQQTRSDGLAKQLDTGFPMLQEDNAVIPDS